jgi:DNA-dependent RNA polymerase auxiliary subunit epsilon
MNIFWNRNAKIEGFITELKKVGYSEEEAKNFVDKHEDYCVEYVDELEDVMRSEGYSEDESYAAEKVEEMDEWRYKHIYNFCILLHEHPYVLEFVPLTSDFYS